MAWWWPRVSSGTGSGSGCYANVGQAFILQQRQGRIHAPLLPPRLLAAVYPAVPYQRNGRPRLLRVPKVKRLAAIAEASQLRIT
jgi:hypothetical protein